MDHAHDIAVCQTHPLRHPSRPTRLHHHWNLIQVFIYADQLFSSSGALFAFLQEFIARLHTNSLHYTFQCLALCVIEWTEHNSTNGVAAAHGCADVDDILDLFVDPVHEDEWWLDIRDDVFDRINAKCVLKWHSGVTTQLRCHFETWE